MTSNVLTPELAHDAHVKPLVAGHWGTTPGQNFIYVHLNRVIKIKRIIAPSAAGN